MYNLVMREDNKSSPTTVRVVVCSPDAPAIVSAGRLAESGLEPVAVESVYEAAAELLAEAAAALVIDLRLLGPRHARLADIARQCGAEMFGVGALTGSMPAEQLSGLRLVSHQDLAETLSQLARATQSPPPREQTESTYQPSAPYSPAPIKPPADSDKEAMDLCPDESYLPTPKSAQPMTPEALLSREELDALLENEP